MDRITRILYHPLFRSTLADIDALERHRPFCGHGIEHLLAVARLAQLYNLEEELGLEKEQIYAAALLHDLGRAAEYRNGTPHERAGIALANPILTDCGFSAQERERICAAIRSHRQNEPQNLLSALLYRADKKCRPCFFCGAATECNWPEEQRNQSIE